MSQNPPAGNRRGQPRVRSEIKELLLLFEISQILEQSVDLQEALAPVLRAINHHTGMKRGTITLIDRETGDIFIDIAHGLSDSERERGRYQVGEGVTGKVVQSGRAVVVPRVSEDPLFLNKTGARKNLRKKDISFLCVPIKIGREVIGTLSLDRLFDEKVTLDEDLRLLTIIASMVAQAARLRQSLQEGRKQLEEENARLHEELKDRFRPSNIIGNSKPMQAVYEQIGTVAASNATVLILGESGTGKELVANAIHYNSPRADAPLIKVNCAALPESIVESELFGHERGAFTGAVENRKGRFELADGGTLFLDEIGELPPAIQVKLLRFLQEKEFERVGGSKTIKADVRVIAATNRDLEVSIAEKKFRQDLYYRLNVFPIHLPPLRDRRTDILLLADHFVEKYGHNGNRRIHRISTPAIDMLMSYHWPGNVRELENCIERAALLSTDGVIHGHQLPPTLQTAEATGTIHEGTLESTLANVERELIADALKTARGNQAEAARALGITERIMGLRVKKYGIDAARFK